MIQLPFKNHFSILNLIAGIASYFQKIFRPVIDQECLILQRFTPGRADWQNILSSTSEQEKPWLSTALIPLDSPQRPAFFDQLHSQSLNSFYYEK